MPRNLLSLEYATTHIYQAAYIEASKWKPKLIGA